MFEETVNFLHDLMFLLAQKVHEVFQGKVIATLVNQNWDLKALNQVLCRLIDFLRLGDQLAKEVDQSLTRVINDQNKQAIQCMQILCLYLQDHDKEIQRQDLSTPMKTF